MIRVVNLFLFWCTFAVCLFISDPITFICSYLFLFPVLFPSLTLQSEQRDQIK